MKRQRLQAARHDTSAPQFQLIELERGRFGIAPARVAQGPIPVIILPTMPETPVPQEFPKISENVYEPGTALQDGRSKGLTKLPMPTTDRAAAFHSEAMDGVGISTKVPLHGYPGQPPRHGPYAGSVGMSGLEDRH
jgi:hypothetical protein